MVLYTISKEYAMDRKGQYMQKEKMTEFNGVMPGKVVRPRPHFLGWPGMSRSHGPGGLSRPLGILDGGIFPFCGFSGGAGGSAFSGCVSTVTFFPVFTSFNRIEPDSRWLRSSIAVTFSACSPSGSRERSNLRRTLPSGSLCAGTEYLRFPATTTNLVG